ncbi:YbjQ family protein [Gilvimarinus algae]|uniref:YbjQ family protein n=1 Tax=Gilvimarinus algae TaxID=3058037 RepID=A0ABT8TCA7_9GAMM|nr:YbjQ family protein [Gilvimarinus sp. SDUM040014]MDO3381727.1 YbjQ family protein [Gilvimarinus sp. SDUM040014]
MNAAFAQLAGPLIVFAALMLCGLIFGSAAERRHYKSIYQRERQLRHVLVFPERLPPPQVPAPSSLLVVGSVVISADYFKRFVAILRMLVGGRLNTYESLLDRARREAILRMKEQAQAQGAQSVFNVKLQTAAIAGRSARAGTACLEVIAYGTALRSPPKR